MDLNPDTPVVLDLQVVFGIVKHRYATSLHLFLKSCAAIFQVDLGKYVDEPPRNLRMQLLSLSIITAHCYQ